MDEGAVHLVPDLAFSSGPSNEGPIARALLEEAGLKGETRPWLGVTLIQWGAQSPSFKGQEHYERAVEVALRHFLSAHGGQVVLFAQVQGPTQAEDDRLPARRLLTRLQDLSGQVLLLDRELPPALLKAAYGQMDIFLWTRLHSNIFALTEGVPVVAIGYQYKTRGIMRMLGLEAWILDIEAVEPQSLAALLEMAWNQRAAIRRHIAEALPPLQEMSSEAGSLLAEDFQRLAAQREKDGLS
jgi:colanic acid/amylovoran biosynthesis protein